VRKDAQTEFARQLRKTMTDAEVRVWFHLRRNQLGGFRFRKQHPVGPYIADFACIEARLIVEIDGSQHGSPNDAQRDAWLRDNGFRILRFWNNDVLNRIHEVLATILDALSSTLPPSAIGTFPRKQRKEGNGEVL
jgi:very-short-patch-repair endonuclease